MVEHVLTENVLKELLSTLSYFHEIPDEELQRILGLLKLKTVMAQEIIIKQGDIGDALFLIARGKVEVLLRQGEEEKKIAVLKEGDIFGEMALIQNKPRSASCIAITDCILYELDRDDLDTVINYCPKLHHALIYIGKERRFSVLHPYYYKRLTQKQD